MNNLAITRKLGQFIYFEDGQIMFTPNLRLIEYSSNQTYVNLLNGFINFLVIRV